MFSRTTIALSTTIPTAKLKPASEITFRFRPVTAMTTNVPITEIGIATPITRVGRGLRRNSSRTRIARLPPRTRFSFTRSTARRM